MIESNYFIRRSEFFASICPKTAQDERHPAWQAATSIVVAAPHEGDKEVFINFRTAAGATAFCGQMKPFDQSKAFAQLPRKEQTKCSTPADAIALFWNNLYPRSVEDRCLPEEPQGNRIFKLPLVSGEFVLLDCSSMYRYQDRPHEVRIPWSTDWNVGTPEKIDESASHRIVSPVVAHVEDQEGTPKIVMQVTMEEPKEEYEVVITTPQGKQFKGLLVLDPSEALKGSAS